MTLKGHGYLKSTDTSSCKQATGAIPKLWFRFWQEAVLNVLQYLTSDLEYGSEALYNTFITQGIFAEIEISWFTDSNDTLNYHSWISEYFATNVVFWIHEFQWKHRYSEKKPTSDINPQHSTLLLGNPLNKLAW